MRKIGLMLLMLAVGMFLGTARAQATTFTLNESALLMLWEVYENPINTTTGSLVVTTNPVEYGQAMSETVGYSGAIKDTGSIYSPFAQMQIGANFWGVSGALGTSGATTAQVIGTALGIGPTNSLVGFDTYSLILENDNDDDWMVNIYMNTGYTDNAEPNNYYQNGWTTVAPHTSVTLMIDLLTVANLNHVTNIGFNIGGNMNGGGSDDPSNPDFFHVSASPTPEPTSLLLLGTGLLGLAGFARRKGKR